MRVREMMAALRKLDQELEVFCYMEDGRVASGHGGGLVMEIVGIEQRRVTRDRGPEGKSALGFVAGETGRVLALIEVTSDV